jgi:hypothetical protein
LILIEGSQADKIKISAELLIRPSRIILGKIEIKTKKGRFLRAFLFALDSARDVSAHDNRG